jgi:hypothetical protein
VHRFASDDLNVGWHWPPHYGYHSLRQIKRWAVLNRISGEAGERSIDDPQFQPSLSGATSRAQACTEIGIRHLGSLDGFRILSRMRGSIAIRGFSGLEDEGDAL